MDDRPIPLPEAEAREYRAWAAFWLQLGVLVLLALLGLYFSSQGDAPGDYYIGLILAVAAAGLIALHIYNRLAGSTGGWGSLLLVDNPPSLFAAIIVFILLGLAGLIIGGRHSSASVQDGGLALFCVCALLVFLSMKRFFDSQETRH
jgi:hypothetical membrane protein